ncbi:hypothetical protein BSNK01_07920 [Bacillaceae bacterium]
MELYELKSYILDSCDFLGIKVKETKPGVYHIKIPEIYRDDFNGLVEIDITFEKNTDPNLTYVTFESFFTQRLAKIVADKNTGTGSGTKILKLDDCIKTIKSKFPACETTIINREIDQTHYLYIWFKTTIRGNMIEEYLKGFKYDMKSEVIDEVTEDINMLLENINEELIDNIDESILDKMIAKLLDVAQQDARNFINKKKMENEELLQKEIQRINEYYDLLESENQLAETSKGGSTRDELELLKKERSSLIDQQIKKFRFNETDATIEPVAILLLRLLVEKATLQITNKFGSVKIELEATKNDKIKCALTKDKDGPFTVTSDHLIVKTEKTFNCVTCGNLYDHSKRNKCKLCNEEICTHCVVISAISNDKICTKHSSVCQICLETVATDELYLCANCNQFYCKKCNPSNICSLCNSLTPVSSITPQLKLIIDLLPADISARKYEYAEIGNRIAVLGKGLLFKNFYLVYDKKEKKIIELQKFNIFGKKKK